ncbi:hypothetical protein BGT96224_5515 [Blumeria graminis f. sp. tritici 96224]|nr:hypothetical protein BGT96224_5515 [Blumeria graminis f. sp. tritici 96224]
MATELYDGAIGIDLVATYEGTNVEIIANEQGIKCLYQPYLDFILTYIREFYNTFIHFIYRQGEVDW